VCACVRACVRVCVLNVCHLDSLVLHVVSELKIMYVSFVCAINSPKFDLPIIETMAQSRGKLTLTCHRCNEVGHKAAACPRVSGSASLTAGDNFHVATSASQHSTRPHYSGFRHDLRPLDQVTCFKVIVVGDC